MGGTSPWKAPPLFLVDGGLAAGPNTNLSRNLSLVPLPSARRNNPSEGKKKEDVKTLGTLKACQTGMKCPFVVTDVRSIW